MTIKAIYLCSSQEMGTRPDGRETKKKRIRHFCLSEERRLTRGISFSDLAYHYVPPSIKTRHANFPEASFSGGREKSGIRITIERGQSAPKYGDPLKIKQAERDRSLIMRKRIGACID